MNEVFAALGMSQPLVSKHLRVPREVGLVDVRDEGRQRMYRLNGQPLQRAMLPGVHYFDSYSVLYETNQYLTSRGCVVLSVDYRGGVMHGTAFRNAPGTSATEYRDILGAIDFQPGVDLAAALQTKRPNVEFGQRVTPEEIHEIYPTFPHLVDTYNDGAQFLLDHL